MMPLIKLPNFSPDKNKSDPVRQLNSNHRLTSIALLALCATGFAGFTQATTLSFDQVRDTNGLVVPTVSGRAVAADYGNRVNATSMHVPGGTFTYGENGEGFTPNISAKFFAGTATPVNPAVSLWQDQYGDLNNVLFGDNNSATLNVQFTADSGFEVNLHHFELAGWPGTDYTINSVKILDNSSTLFSQTNVLVEGDTSGNRHTSFDFATPLSATDLIIQIDFSNLPGGQQDNIGIDNIQFAQNPPATIPLPSSWLLLGSGLAWLARKTSH